MKFLSCGGSYIQSTPIIKLKVTIDGLIQPDQLNQEGKAILLPGAAENNSVFATVCTCFSKSKKVQKYPRLSTCSDNFK